MGAVYEADEIESGRRVAVKVLKERLNDPRERERFNREGRLAASLNHPHCVFVFAASEVDGRLAIAMELMQGTLADRVKAHGPLPPAEAADAALQLISGLEAAAAIGILHRDVKPSNCFVSADGVVKIGDFGISRSLRPTEDTGFSTRTRFAATPAYASPEQLRGAALDTRADIYSLGATLYELLTGRPPFERDDLMALLMAVANDVPQPPHARAPAIPTGLSRLVLRCLAKQPDRRFTDYDALARALEPYSSTAPSPATLGRRFVAGVVDLCLLGLLSVAFSFSWLGVFVPLERAVMLRQQVTWAILLLAYFGIAESVWVATPGKALVGITLVDPNGQPPRAGRVVARAALFAAVWTAGSVLWLALRTDSSNLDIVISTPWIVFLMSVLPWVFPAAVFSTARRRNGYAALHDLVTGTRVVERRGLTRTASSGLPAALTSTPEALAHLGPFQVMAGPLPGMPAGWRPGVDTRLRRNVWIRESPPGTPPLQAGRLAVSRPTRLRWLAGRREPDQAWDAFEAVAGVPLEQACVLPRAWTDVRWWLLDLARECAAQAPDDRPPLRADRVWALDSGAVKLVDDPLVDGSEDPAAIPQSARLLLDVARAARGPSVQPWPLRANRFIDRLTANPPPSHAFVVSELESLTQQRGAVTRGWRALHILGLVALPLLFTGSGLFSALYEATQRGRMPLEVYVASIYLNRLRSADDGRIALSASDLDALEVALASRYRHVLTDPRLSLPDYQFVGLWARVQVERVLRRQPTETQTRRAFEHPFVRSTEDTVAQAGLGLPPAGSLPRLGFAVFVVTLEIVALFALVAALSFRGGLLRALGMEIVTPDGRPASRVRAAARTLLAWAPLIVLGFPASQALLSGVVPKAETMTASGLALLILLAGAIVAVLQPSRGIQDRLAGTWIVPR
jgi:tRNA A-37 threonylcarbamoyl transferase component Bud32